jgi:hypothetical protein
VSRTPTLAAALGAALLAALPLAAAAESPYYGSLELRAGGFKPNADASFDLSGGGVGPYAAVFPGTGRPTGFWLHAARALPFRQYGTIELGGGVGYWSVSGHAVTANNVPTVEKTSFKIVPTEVSVTYRADVLWERWRVPLVPYARAGLERYNWWITGPGGGTSKTGATNGLSWGGGVGLVLDLLDPTLARELDADSGINHTILVFDAKKSKVDDFGSKSSWDLSDAGGITYSFGLLFVF